MSSCHQRKWISLAGSLSESRVYNLIALDILPPLAEIFISSRLEPAFESLKFTAERKRFFVSPVWNLFLLSLPPSSYRAPEFLWKMTVRPENHSFFKTQEEGKHRRNTGARYDFIFSFFLRAIWKSCLPLCDPKRRGCFKLLMNG